jgi:hypothetical protein
MFQMENTTPSIERVPSNNRDSGVIIFMHLQKTAGTTFSKILETLYKKEEVFNIEGRAFRESIRRFKAIPESLRNQYNVIKGHMFFGLHESISRPFRYMTILREPLARVISNYYMALERPRFPFHDEIVKMTFEQFMHFGELPALDNGMTRMICGCDLDCAPYGCCTSDMLEKAKDNVRNHFLIGLTERFDESLVFFKHVLDWDDVPTYEQYNITKSKPADVCIEENSLRSVEKYIELDRELYNFCVEVYNNQINRMDEAFFEEVQAYVNKKEGKM